MAAYTFPTGLPASYVVGDTITFNHTGASQTFSTLNINTMKVELWGGAGGGAGSEAGGLGGYSYGIYSTIDGTTVYVYVGGKGTESASTQTYNTQPAGAFNGGGQAPFQHNGTTATSWGKGGGGATDIRIGGTATSNRILIAGGGGGGGNRNVQLTGYAGGGAGGGCGFMSQNGNPGSTASARTPGSGGTQAAGGAGGLFNYDIGTTTGTNGTAGSLAQGGSGGAPTSGYWDYAGTGGSGGGGYYGGGGGCCGGYDGRGGSAGGGGSGYVNTTYITAYGGESGVRSGNGIAIITVLS